MDLKKTRTFIFLVIYLLCFSYTVQDMKDDIDKLKTIQEMNSYGYYPYEQVQKIRGEMNTTTDKCVFCLWY